MKTRIALFFILFFPWIAFAIDNGAGWYIKNNCVPENRCTTTETEDYKIYRIEPIYPFFALKNHIEGSVELEFLMNPDGMASDLEIIRSAPLSIFDESAIQAVQLWYFEAISEKGKTESIRALQKFTFKLRKNEVPYYHLSSERLYFPKINIIDQFGGVATYEVGMELELSNNKIMFRLAGWALKENIESPETSDIPQYFARTGLLEIPEVNTVDQYRKTISTYKATMKLKSSNEKMVFELIEILEK